ncbi:MAG: 2-C-methyl-D-erythritol 4-phosphate cytidylyltransferase [Elusimicrobia bacterium]|nr:2-C-methyl-D-erythritol 4-phosphate cytidylyltransferase [Elusimicrobiota bacterium]
MKVSAIIVAAGLGKRFGSKKQFIFLGKKRIFETALSKFLKVPEINNIVVVLPKEDLTRHLNLPAGVSIVAGGKTRQHSVFNGLCVLPSDTGIVIIHDGVRPFITTQIIKRSILSAKKYGASVVAVPAKDTVKIVKNGLAVSTPVRKSIFLAQTPQTFKYSLIIKAYKKAFKDGYLSTDDSALVERLGKKVKIVLGDYKNIKITTKEDIKILKD